MQKLVLNIVYPFSDSQLYDMGFIFLIERFDREGYFRFLHLNCLSKGSELYFIKFAGLFRILIMKLIAVVDFIELRIG